jgi:hypothetical protein
MTFFQRRHLRICLKRLCVLFRFLKIVIPENADDIFTDGAREKRVATYVPDHISQVFLGQPKKLADCDIDPTKALDYLSMGSTCIPDDR